MSAFELEDVGPVPDLPSPERRIVADKRAVSEGCEVWQFIIRALVNVDEVSDAPHLTFKACNVIVEDAGEAYKVIASAVIERRNDVA